MVWARPPSPPCDLTSRSLLKAHPVPPSSRMQRPWPERRQRQCLQARSLSWRPDASASRHTSHTNF